MSTSSARPSRRVLVGSAVWATPILALTAPAPAFAASPCTLRSARVATTTAVTTSPVQGYTRGSNTAATWRTADPDGAATTYTNARILVSATKQGAIEYGFNGTTNNLIVFTTGGVTGVSINQRPTTTTSPRGYDNRTITKFDFQRPVYDLNFTVADISKSGSPTGTSAFWDALWVETDGTFSVINRGTYVVGNGTSASDPLTPSNTAPDGADQDAANVTLQFSGRTTLVTLHYWSATKGATSGTGQGITVSNLSMLLAPDVCP